MGTLRKAVVLSEGAKPGIPTIKVEKIDHGSVEMTITVKKTRLPRLVQKSVSVIQTYLHTFLMI
jgi:hypothetical protein